MTFPYEKLGAFEKVVISYNGSNDEGWIEDILPDPPIECVEISRQLYTELEGIAYDVLESNYPGWEINEGSQGTITLDVRARSAALHHGEHYEQTRWHDTAI